MIKLNRNGKPNVLGMNEATWKNNLSAAIARHGSYNSIPKDEKEQLISHYRHSEIKQALFSSSFEKCAFCESKPAESGDIEVEHFRPKSLYPDLTFEWNNLLPSCRKCNGTKLDHDTGLAPIVNPYDIDPADIFYYEDIRMLARNGNQLGKTTIDVCGLNSVRLMKPRANILVSLHSFSQSLDDAISDYKNSDTELKKRNRLRKINEAIEKIDQLSDPGEKYSAFCKSYISHCGPYAEARKILSEL